jgi:hypothetical protein
MPRVFLPPGCGGFADGDRKYLAERGPGSYVNIEDGSPQLKKLQAQDYASAGLVDAGPEKFFSTRKDDGRWCKPCKRVWQRWSLTCPKCGRDTIPEADMPARVTPAGPYMP